MRRTPAQNILTVLNSNIVMVILGILISLLLPLIIGSVESYGYWQIYYFYSSFYGLMLFGLNDGMNLLYSGTKYEDLDSKKFTAFLTFLVSSSVALVFVLIFVLFLYTDNAPGRFIAIATIVSMLVLNITGYVLHIHQISLQFKKYARINVLERLIFVGSFAPLYFIDEKDFVTFIAMSFASRILNMIYSLTTISDLIKRKYINLHNTYSYRRFILQNIRLGLPISISTIVAMLIITSPRIIVERTMSIYDFGLFSLAFAILSIIVMMVSTLSTVLYPSLKTKSNKKYREYNHSIRYVISILCGIAFIFTFAIPRFIDIYLPDYQPILQYIFILIPWVMYQCLGGMLNDVFFRLGKLQKSLLLTNIVGLIAIFSIQYTALSISSSIELTLIIGLSILATWFHLGDYYLHRKNGWKISIYNFMDIPIVLSFILVTQVGNSYIGAAVYCILLAFIVYLTRNKLYIVLKRFTN